MKTPFKDGDGKGIDTSRKFIVRKPQLPENYKKGDIVSYVYSSAFGGHFITPSGDNRYIRWSELDYAPEEISFTRGERVMTENGERIFLAEIEGAHYPFICVRYDYEDEFNNGEPFSTVVEKRASKLPTVTEMTMEQVELALGKKVKIISKPIK